MPDGHRWVGCDGDLISIRNGKRRYTEVKTIASEGDDCNLSENPRATLERLGPEAWRAVSWGCQRWGEVSAVPVRLQGPIRSLAAEQMAAVVWNVPLGPLLA